MANSRQQLRELAHGYYYSCALFATVRVGLADQLAHEGHSAEDLAHILKLDLGALRRLLTFLASFGAVEQETSGLYRLSEGGQYLRSDHPQTLVQEVSMFSGGETYQAWGDLLYSLQTGRPAFDHVFGKPLFEYFADHPETGSRFHNGWEEITLTTAQEMAEAFDLSEATTLMDVGGGHGIFLCKLLEKNPELQATLFDLPVSVKGARAVIASHRLEDRINVIEGDATVSIPKWFDLYLMKSVIHVCDDQQARAILTRCAEALPPHGKVLVVERIIPVSPGPHWSKLVDMTMLVMTGGRERTESEYRNLFKETGLCLTQVLELPSGFSVIVAQRA